MSLYHVADPAFWKLWKQHGSSTYVNETPRLGEKQLGIHFRRPARNYVLFGGGMVTGVMLLHRDPDIVRVTLADAPQPVDLRLRKGVKIRFEGAQDQVQLRIFESTVHRVGVLVDYYWQTPEDVSIICTQEHRTAEGGFRTQYARGVASVEYLKHLLNNRNVPISTEGAFRNCIALAVRRYIESNKGRIQPEATLHLPSQLRPAKFLANIEGLVRFADFARQHHPQPGKKLQHVA